MKLRYYMRGLGIGIVVTAILMGVTINGKTEKLTDAEIIERAEALGMEQRYETTVLSDTVSENETDEVDMEEVKVDEESGKNDMPTEQADIEPQVIETDVQEFSDDSKREEQPETSTEETVQITVQGGDGSQTVARKLAQAGLVEDAIVYDKYLCANGYDKKICTGTHTVPVGASDEEIAKIITRRQ